MHLRTVSYRAIVAGAVLLAASPFLAAAEEVSPGGSTIYRHEGKVPDHSDPKSEAEHVSEIEDALTPYLGENYVFHEIVSTTIHLDILIFRPTEKRNHWTFVTSGMSDLAMTVPEGIEPREQYQFSELVIAVPANWFTQDAKGMIPETELADEDKFWPIWLIKFLGRFPHEYKTWFWESHSIPNGDPATPYAGNTKLSGVILAPLHTWPKEYRQVTLKNGSVVNFVAVVPVHDDEMTAKLDLGFESVFSALTDAGVTEVVDITRPSIAPKLAN